MGRCCECGCETEGDAAVCEACATVDVVSQAEEGGETVEAWTPCRLCEGTGRCFFCSPGGPCYHCSGSGREPPGSEAECHICGGDGDLGKGCNMCGYTRRCIHCNGTGKVPASLLQDWS